MKVRADSFWAPCLNWNPSGTKLLLGTGVLAIYDLDGKTLGEIGGVGGTLVSAWLDDDRFVFGGSSQDVQVFDTTNLQVASTFRVQSGRIEAVDQSNGGWMLAGSRDGTIRRINLKNASVSQAHIIKAHDAPCGGLDWEPKGNLISTSGRDGAGRIWNATSGELIHQLKGHPYPAVHDIVWRGDGKQLASIDYAGNLLFWKSDTGELINTGRIPISGEHPALSWSRSNGALAVGGALQHVVVVRPPSTKILAKSDVRKHTFRPSWNPNGRLIGAVSKGGDVILIDPNTGKTLFADRIPGTNVSGRGIAWSPDGQLLAGGGETIRIYDASRLRVLAELRGHRDQVRNLGFDPTGRRIASVGAENNLMIWDVATGSPLLQLPVPDERLLTRVAWSPDGRRIAITTTSGNLWIFGSPNMPKMSPDTDFLRDGAIAAKVYPPEDETKFVLTSHSNGIGGIRNIVATPDEHFIIAAGYTKGLKLWDVEMAKFVDRFEPFEEPFYSVDIDRNGKHVITSTFVDGKIQLWDFETGKLIRSFDSQHGPSPNSTTTRAHFRVRFSPDGQTIASIGEDYWVRLWNLEGELQTEHKTKSGVFCGVFHPKDGVFVHGSGSRAIIWDIKSDEFRVLPKRQGLVRAIALTTDSEYVLTGDGSGEIVLSSINTCQNIRTFHEERVIYEIQFLPGDQFFLTAGLDGILRLWDIGQNDKPVAEIKSEESIFETIALLDGGRTVATAGWQTIPRTQTSRALHIWQLPKMLWSEEDEVKNHKPAIAEKAP